MDKVLLQTGRDDWETPKELFEKLDREFHFTLDPCSSHENAKCRKHYTAEENGLEKDWVGEVVFCNPPYFSGPERRGYYGRKDGGMTGHRNDYHIAAEAWRVPDERYFRELQRVAKRYIIWGCNYFAYPMPPGRIVWDKCKVGLDFVGFEIDPENFVAEERRFAEYTAQRSFFYG